MNLVQQRFLKNLMEFNIQKTKIFTFTDPRTTNNISFIYIRTDVLIMRSD
jgi:hypothetical protein